MAFCGKCGASLDGERFCPDCGTPVESKRNGVAVTADSHTYKKVRLWKKVVLGVAAAIVILYVITRYTSTVDKPCDWCGNRPSVAYKMNDDSYSYVCKDCSKECAWCGKRATKHYENLADMMVFVCDDCYKEISED